MEQKFNVLLAEDDLNLGTLLAECFEMKDFDVTLCQDGGEAFSTFKKDHFDLLIIDIMMPLKDGFTLIRDIRMLDADVPIIVLTARNLKEDVLKGFSLGADDYVAKPFSMEELLMRVQAVLKRTNRNAEPKDPQPDEYTFGITSFNHIFQTLKVADTVYRLTSRENEVLKTLCRYKNEMVLRDFALREIWGDSSYFNGRSMDVFVSKLRRLLEPDHTIEIINVHGRGFKLIDKKHTTG